MGAHVHFRVGGVGVPGKWRSEFSEGTSVHQGETLSRIMDSWIFRKHAVHANSFYKLNLFPERGDFIHGDLDPFMGAFLVSPIIELRMTLRMCPGSESDIRILGPRDPLLGPTKSLLLGSTSMRCSLPLLSRRRWRGGACLDSTGRGSRSEGIDSDSGGTRIVVECEVVREAEEVERT